RERRFVLYEDRAHRPVILTQRDVRQVQLAKAPIRAGMEVMLEEMGTDAEDIDEVFVAGAFGSSMRAESLLALGMLPEGLRGRIHSAGNVAGMGAKLAVTFEQRLDEARRLARCIRHVELMLRDDFQSRFAQYIPFPEPEAG
ncbi:MAG: ASKHA domain-containing protein, partial [Dehalococcoidia bacterium]